MATSKVESRQDLDSKILAYVLKDAKFKQTILSDPDAARAKIAELTGQPLPENLKIQVVEETENLAYVVLPYVPSAGQQLTEEQLDQVASGATIQLDCMLGSLCITTDDGAGC